MSDEAADIIDWDAYAKTKGELGPGFVKILGYFREDGVKSVAAIEANPPPAPGGKRIKMRYVTQVKTRPPSFVIFGTRVDQLPASYERYLVNSMRRELGFGAVPVRLTFRAPKNPFDNQA